MLFGKKYVENIQTNNEYAFSVPAPDKYFIHIVVYRNDEETKRRQYLSFKKDDKEALVFDKVGVGETLEQAFRRVFTDGYGFKDFESATITGGFDRGKDREGRERPRFTINVRVDPSEKHNSHFENYKMSWVSLPNSYELFKELTKYKSPGIAFVPTEKDSLSQSVSKYGGLPILPSDIKWPACKFCDKSLDFICQFSIKDFPTMPIPSSDISHLLIFACLNEQDFLVASQVETVWASSNQEVIKQIPDKGFPENRYQEPPVECMANPMKLVDFVTMSNYKHPELEKLFSQLEEDRREYYLNHYMPYEGTKVNGEPSFIQDDEYPTCVKCGKKMEFWGQLSSEEPVTRMLKKDFSDHRLMWGDVGTIYLFYCKDWCTKEIKSIRQCS